MSNVKKAVALIGGQTETGKILGVKQQVISTWVNQSQKAPGRYIRKLAELTNGDVTIEQLLADHEKKIGKGE
jgi:DNA-binding transcriptional regulator YdaS (Cro superfamily)